MITSSSPRRTREPRERIIYAFPITTESPSSKAESAPTMDPNEIRTRSPNCLRSILRSGRTHIYTAWLFTASDMKSIILPSTAFAYFTSLSEDNRLPGSLFLRRSPLILAWLWIHLLAFAVNNQRHPASIREDAINKPWRPIVADRVAPKTAKVFGKAAYGLAMAASFVLRGGHIESCLIVLLSYMYNEMGLGSSHWVARNVFNAFGITSFGAGALSVALQSRVPAGLFPWLGVVVAVVSTTIHSQDMYDQEGDAAVGRKTVPLVMGDAIARWTVAGGVTFWSCVAPRYWNSPVVGYVLPVAVGMGVSWRTLTSRTVAGDRATYRLYNVWLACIYVLPLTATTLQDIRSTSYW
jgi:4-hydroxybenzoate polyprenyltransferase